MNTITLCIHWKFCYRNNLFSNLFIFPFVCTMDTWPFPLHSQIHYTYVDNACKIHCCSSMSYIMLGASWTPPGLHIKQMYTKSGPHFISDFYVGLFTPKWDERTPMIIWLTSDCWLDWWLSSSSAGPTTNNNSCSRRIQNLNALSPNQNLVIETKCS